MSDRRALLANAAARAAAYLESLDTRPVFPPPEDVESLRQAMQGALPKLPTPPEDVLALLDETAGPATVASAGGRYFGFVTGAALPATVAANWLATAWDQNSFNSVSSPAITLIEATALRWVKEALDLPATAEGTFVTGATMANFTCLAAARQSRPRGAR